MLSNVLVTDNSVDSSFNTREILVIILVQCFCLVNGCIYFGVICSLVLKGIDRILYSFRHCIHLCLLGFTLPSVNSVNGIFYRRIICIKVAIKSLCTCDGRINSCVISENVIVIPHKSWMADSGNPLNARTGIGSQAIKDICGGKVCDGSTLLFVALSSYIRKRRRVICFRVIRPIAIFYRAIEGISYPAGVNFFCYGISANILSNDHAILDSCSVGISNNSANGSQNRIDNYFAAEPAICDC